ncbi:Sso2p [Sugiyamaella lignohabitans]|uniref:Sso2p n=1 Tax=Sugiyamaella lignohabitans TaxID=796027 RepID=A0A161HGG9_9ASCO|nr:Sso2p [Sugiyamaella lignohabitans]ANB11891.1 Sso2p [Sugiyamaella lignohabitans]
MIAFFGELDDIKRNLVQYDDNVDRIEALHKRSLAEVGGEHEDYIQGQIESLTQDTQALADTLKARIKTLQAKSTRDSTKKTQAENVKRQFLSSIQKYQTTEARFRQKYREAAERQFRIVRPDATDAEVKEAIEDSAGVQIFSQALMNSNRRGQARTALTEVQTRHREIQKIEQTMAELAQLFRDMEVLVAEQEEPIRHIDEQAATVQTDIEQGVSHTQKAIFSARAARKKKWWCLGIVLIIVIILAVVLGVKLSN